MYLFLGVSIIADRFMASIEVITSQVLFNFIFLRNNVAVTYPRLKTNIFKKYTSILCTVYDVLLVASALIIEKLPGIVEIVFFFYC